VASRLGTSASAGRFVVPCRSKVAGGFIGLRRAVLTVSLFSFALASSGRMVTANAQAPEASATQLAAKAKRAQELGRLEEAIDGYARAYQVSGEAVLLFSLAEVHRDAGHLEDALRIFQTYVRRDPDGAHRATADQQIQDLEKRIEKTKQSRAPGASGGAAAAGQGASAPAPVPVPVPRMASPALPPSATSPPAPASVVSVSPPQRQPPAPIASPARAGAAGPSPTSPPPLVPPPPAPLAETAAPPAGADLVASPVPGAPDAAPPPLPRWVPWALTVATVGLGVGAIVSGVSASNRYDQLLDSCGRAVGGCAATDIDDVRSRARRANILWLLTSAAAVGAGVTIYVNVNAAGASGLWSF
jgi:hypothetical protein